MPRIQSVSIISQAMIHVTQDGDFTKLKQFALGELQAKFPATIRRNMQEYGVGKVLANMITGMCSQALRHMATGLDRVL